MSSYNPFTPIGRYHIKTYFYENKNKMIAVCSILIFLLCIIEYHLFFSPDTAKRTRYETYTAPLPPKYGYGPYGYGLYAPSKEVLESISQYS